MCALKVFYLASFLFGVFVFAFTEEQMVEIENAYGKMMFDQAQACGATFNQVNFWQTCMPPKQYEIITSERSACQEDMKLFINRCKAGLL